MCSDSGLRRASHLNGVRHSIDFSNLGPDGGRIVRLFDEWGSLGFLRKGVFPQVEQFRVLLHGESPCARGQILGPLVDRRAELGDQGGSWSVLDGCQAAEAMMRTRSQTMIRTKSRIRMSRSRTPTPPPLSKGKCPSLGLCLN